MGTSSEEESNDAMSGDNSSEGSAMDESEDEGGSLFRVRAVPQQDESDCSRAVTDAVLQVRSCIDGSLFPPLFLV